MSKPIDLIVANTMHDTMRKVTDAHTVMCAATGKDRSIEVDRIGREAIARHLLCQIAHDASMSNVFAALKAIGAPHSDDDISESVKAVLESMSA